MASRAVSTRWPLAIAARTAADDHGVVNRLGTATSPYLLQHADNPVDWWEWGPEAFAEAERRDVPVLLFFSLRRQVRRISPDLPYADDVDTEASGPSSESQPPTTPPAAPDITSPGKSG
jgi:hypothetical protein